MAARAWIVLPLLLIAAASPPAAAEPARRALLIGINEYRSDDFGNLRGALNDLDLLRHVLTTRFGFPEGNVATLTDSDATRAGILHALQDFVAGCGPQDEVWIHYSGHGSQVEDLDGDEEDGMDETLVPHDGRTEGVPDITDDELGAILAELPTSKALVTLDSCHSGTATRGAGIRTRSVPRDDRLDLYARADVARRGVTTLESGPYVLMTGAAPDQSALDGPIDGEYFGFFSYCLGTALGEAPPGVSTRDVFSRLEQVLGRLQEHFGGISMPEPQLEGPGGRLDGPLFPDDGSDRSGAGNEAAARFAYLPARPDRGGVVLLGGAAAGALPGSRWALFPPGESEFVPGGAIALALVIGLDGADAFAEVLPTGTDVPDGARAIAAAPPPAATRIPVLLDIVPAAMARTIRDRVSAELPSVEFVDPDAFARFIVDVEDDACSVYGLAGLSLVDTFAAGDARQVAERLVAIFARSSSASMLASLRNPSSQLSLDVREALPASGAARGFQAASSAAPAAYRFRAEGAPRTASNSLMLEIQADRDCFITIVDVDPSGRINQLFPNDYQSPAFLPDGLIAGGELVRIPDSFDAGNEAGFFWDCGPPAGQEAIQVFASTDLETAEFYRAVIAEMASDVQSRGAGRVAPNPLGELGARLAERWTPRGFQVVADEPATETDNAPEQDDGFPEPEWNAVSITVRVEK